ncbi:MAG: hypothetical protein ABS69_02940 [Nitrosomonadales bacterium SCN 54-20]|nr:MAG: hypothetical protein ABS69_02940 [Nitrosomonadales bacterium SCN 54-20]
MKNAQRVYFTAKVIEPVYPTIQGRMTIPGFQQQVPENDFGKQENDVSKSGFPELPDKMRFVWDVEEVPAHLPRLGSR